MENRVLIIVAHPDDEVLGCGATTTKYSKDNQIYVLILGEGLTSRDNTSGKELLELKEKAQKAGKILGVKENFFFDLPDQKFDTISFLDIVKKIESVIKKINPEIIYTHGPYDLNLDHRITFEAVLTATRPVNDKSVKEIYSFEIPSSTEWSFSKINSSFKPNVFEDITLFIDKKIEALKIYESEMREFPHPRSKEAILVNAKRWGSVVGVSYVEAFQLVRKLI